MASLYVVTPRSVCSVDSHQLIVEQDGNLLTAAPVRNVDRIVVLDQCSITNGALRRCLLEQIDVVFVSRVGQLRGTLSNTALPDPDRIRNQLARTESESFVLAIARRAVDAKISNMRSRIMRIHRAEKTVHAASDWLANARKQLATATSVEEIMGIEGTATRIYFAVVRTTLRPPWTFTSRIRRPPPDPVNAALSLTSTFLTHACTAALRISGLHPEIGFLHHQQGRRPSLALDLMEPYRPVIADSAAFAVFNRRIIRPIDITGTSNGQVILSHRAIRAIIRAYEQRMETVHDLETLAGDRSWRKIIEIDARSLNRAIIHDDPTLYRPVIVR